jgi:DNA-binding Lrp family transcriptional regulator
VATAYDDYVAHLFAPHIGKPHCPALLGKLQYSLRRIAGYYLSNRRIFRRNIKMDPTDQRLLALLRENARASTTELARQLGLSRTTVQSRIERLERDGVVIGYTVRTSAVFDAGQVRAMVMITATPKLTPAIEGALRRIPQVRTLHSVSGIFDFIAGVEAGSVGELDGLVDRIGALDGVERTSTAIVMTTRIDR